MEVMHFILVAMLCSASAALGRLLLTVDAARATLAVRLPALLALFVMGAMYVLSAIIWAVICFVGGSFYGLTTWWAPPMIENFWCDALSPLFQPVITGRWQ